MSIVRQDSEKLPVNLFQKVMDRLSLGSMNNDYEGLTALYKAWSRNVPFDNLQKRIGMSRQDSRLLPGGNGVEFFENFLNHGTGGTCWPTSEGLYTLLKSAGFDAVRSAGSMLDVGDNNQPNHGTVVVNVDKQTYLLDTTMLSEEPLLLIEKEDTKTEHPIHGIRSDYSGEQLKVWWSPGHTLQYVAFQLEHEQVNHDFFLKRYEITRDGSLFNASLYFRINTDDGVLTIGRDKKMLKKEENGEVQFKVEDLTAEERRNLLLQLGVSEEVLNATPADEAGIAFD